MVVQPDKIWKAVLLELCNLADPVGAPELARHLRAKKYTYRDRKGRVSYRVRDDYVRRCLKLDCLKGLAHKSRPKKDPHDPRIKYGITPPRIEFEITQAGRNCLRYHGLLPPKAR